jgi:long-chain acyl-CoA synthetase
MENLVEMLKERCRVDPDKTAYLVKENEKWSALTWAEVDEKVEYLAAGLVSLGLDHGNTVCILGDTCLEWGLSDLAVLRAGGISVGIYQTLSGEQSAYVLEDSNTKVLFIEGGKQIEKLAPYLDGLPDLEWVVVWDESETGPNTLNMIELMDKGKEALKEDAGLVSRIGERIKPSDMAIIIYTSGTTGPPKGACLSHANIMALFEKIDEVTDREMLGDVMMSFLPLAHAAERLAGLYIRIYLKITGAFVKDLTRILDDISDIKPKFFGSVPRIFEKAYDRIRAEEAAATPIKQKIFRWAEGVGREVSRYQQKGNQPPLMLKAKYALADRLVFSKIRGIFGGEARYFLSGAAPIATEILEFFHASGMLVMECYGQTEATGISTINTKEDYRFGSVGKPLPGVEVKIAEDGEVLIKGELVFMGYRNQPELTSETISGDGWLHTGDIGRFDEDGFLWITGRIKEIIITSGGKNVTPSNIENLLKNHPLIDQVMVHGDKRKYLTALIGMAPEQIEAWAKANGHKDKSYEELTKLDELRDEIERFVTESNKKLARFETIKKFVILPAPLEVETGELTPTLKVKRRVVEEKYKQLLDDLYE